MEDYFGEQLEELQQEAGVQFGKYNVVIPPCKPPRSNTMLTPKSGPTGPNGRMTPSFGSKKRTRSQGTSFLGGGPIESFSLGSSVASLDRADSSNYTSRKHHANINNGMPMKVTSMERNYSGTSTGTVGGGLVAIAGLDQYLNQSDEKIDINNNSVTNTVNNSRYGTPNLTSVGVHDAATTNASGHGDDSGNEKEKGIEKGSVDIDNDNDKYEVIKGASLSFSININKIKSVTPQVMKNDENKYIPESLIAQQLRQRLNELMNDYNLNLNKNIMINDDKNENGKENKNGNDNDNDYETKEETACAADDKDKDKKDKGKGNCNRDMINKICDEIIVAYDKLYSKYIDSQNAFYMINISGNVRNQIAYWFDKEQYKRLIGKGKKGSGSFGSFGIVSLSRKASVTGHGNMSKGDNRNHENNGDIIMTNNIRASFQDYIKDSKNKNVNIEDVDLISWTLEQVLTTIEPSAIEIGNLMNDSFSRFRRQHQTT